MDTAVVDLLGNFKPNLRKRSDFHTQRRCFSAREMSKSFAPWIQSSVLRIPGGFVAFQPWKKMEQAFEQQEGYRTSPNRRGTGVASIWCGEEEEAGRLRWTDHSTNGGRGGEDRIGKGKWGTREEFRNSVVGTLSTKKGGDTWLRVLVDRIIFWTFLFFTSSTYEWCLPKCFQMALVLGHVDFFFFFVPLSKWGFSNYHFHLALECQLSFFFQITQHTQTLATRTHSHTYVKHRVFLKEVITILQLPRNAIRNRLFGDRPL
jgi:hypothetical protein